MRPLVIYLPDQRSLFDQLGSDQPGSYQDGAPAFEGFPKIARLSCEITITEKLDGTNAQIVVTEKGQVFVGSKNRYLEPGADNHGFLQWAYQHRDELRAGLGVGRHFGEWWGVGIGRGYGLKEKRFSLFNTARWTDNRPGCCQVVPILYQGVFSEEAVRCSLRALKIDGSYAARGFMNPEGIVMFHHAAGTLFKKTLEHDEQPKGRR